MGSASVVCEAAVEFAEHANECAEFGCKDDVWEVIIV